MNHHDQKVRLIADQVRSIAADPSVLGGRPISYVKKSVSHVVPNPYQQGGAPKIDLSPLNEILEIDVDNQICIAESGVTFTELTRQTVPLGLMPVVVPELETVTIGGAVSGCSIESQSYHLGGFHDSCLEYEVIDGRGDIITCSPTERPDIFQLVHGGYGTLGIVTKLKFKLMPCKPYVHLDNVLFDNFDDFWAALLQHCQDADFPFIDAIIHDPEHFVLCLGRMVDYAPFLSRYDGTEIYYKSTLTKSEDFMELRHYFLRYDGECHWLTKTVPGLENKIVRKLFGKLFIGSTKLIKLSNMLKPVLRRAKLRPDIVVDVFVPKQRFADFFEWYKTDFDFFPLWIVPYRMPEFYPWIADEQKARAENQNFMIDVAVYGKPNCDPEIDYSERLEKKVAEVGGIKTLIGRNHYSPEEFWQTYSKPRIEAAKAAMDPQNLFGTIYDRMVLKK